MVYGVHEWAEVNRLFHREHVPKARIARQLKMSRTTVCRLAALEVPPRYERPRKGSLLDPHKDRIRELLGEAPTAPATVILQHLRKEGYQGGITVLKDHLTEVRPLFVVKEGFGRTVYLPGEICQLDWWETGQMVDVGKGHRAEAFGLVATLPYCAAHAVVFCHAMTTADFLWTLRGCLARLGGLPEAFVVDRDTSIVNTKTGKPHLEVAALLGELRVRAIVLPPRSPESKGQAERTIDYLERSFLPLRRFESLVDLQAQADAWAAEIAFARHHRRVGAKVGVAHTTEKSHLAALPDVWPDTDQKTEARIRHDLFVRVAGRDYSVPPGLVGRRVQVRLSARQVTVFLEGRQVARHQRSFVPADVVADPEHVAALKAAKEAKRTLAAGDVELAPIDLSRYDALVGAAL